MGESKTILLRDPLEFLVFNQEVITLFVDHNTTISGCITEFTDNELVIYLGETENQFFSPDLSGQEFKITCDYRAKRLEFSATVKNYNETSRWIATSIPHQGHLKNYRLWERTNFDFDPAELSAKIEVNTALGPATFHSSALCEFSYTDISLYIDRQQGLILPDDIVDNIVITSVGNTVFEASGRITRIEKENSAQDRLFVVIKLNDPNAKPVLDIEPNKRQSDRYIFEDRNHAFIEFVHPFTGARKIAQILDISNYGVSVVMQDGKFAMPPGLMLEEASMQLPMSGRLNLGLRVKAFTPDEDALKVSMVFVNPTPMLVKSVSNYVQTILSSNLQDATYEDLNELWYFYFETGFIYKEKRRHLQQSAETVKETFRRLLKNNTPLLKKILYKEEGVIKGHVTAIKVFDRTLMVQHLNALKAKNESAAMQVVRAITSYFMDHKANMVAGNRFICFYYRPNNTYPSIVFGEAVKLINNESVCWTFVYQYCLPSGHHETVIDNDIKVAEADYTDLTELESLLIRNREYNILKLECLAREQLVSMTISEEFKEIGLYRYRKVFVAKHAVTGERVYAVCNYASPGLNFSELTNGIKLFYDQENTPSAQVLIDALCETALQSYQDTDVKDPPLLLKTNQPIPASYMIEKNYTLFALDINHTKKFKNATEHVFSNFKEFIKRKKAV